MKYVAEIDGEQLNLVLEDKDGGFRVTLEDTSYEISAASPEPGVYLIFDGVDVYEASVSTVSGGSMRVKVRGRMLDARVIDQKHRGQPAERSVEGKQALFAPMPGKVVKLLLGVGDPVATGQGVLVVEAMKMQNEIKSPKSGRVIEVRVSENDTVEANQVVAIVE
jgi:biotin carboxyl carrier protein